MDSLERSRNPDEIRRELYEVANDQHLSLATKRERLLELGRAYLGVENAHVERIDGGSDTHQVVASVGGGPDLLPEGTTLDGASTYCRRTVEADSPVALSDAAEQGWADDPAYHEHGFACYLGTTVFVRGEAYGTVCFVSRDARPAEFAPEEKAFAELVARLLGRELERTRSDAELTGVESKYASLIRSAPDAIFLASAEGGEVVEANPAAAELTGYAPGELEGMPYAHLHPPENRDRYHALFDRLLAEGGTTSRLPGGGHVEILTAGGDRVPVEMSAAAVELPEGRHVQGILRDVSDRVARQRTLERQTELFEDAQSLAAVGGWEYDLRTGDLYWTDEVRRIHEVGDEYVPTMGAALEFYPDEHGRRIREAVGRAVRDGDPFDLELRLVTAEGTPRWVRVQGKPRVDGETARLRGTIQDVTERREREDELRLKNRAMDEAGVGISIAEATEDQPLVYVNDAFTDLTGYGPGTVLGENCRFLQGPGTDPDDVADLRAAIAAETDHHAELLNYRADGTPFWNELTITPVEGEDGSTTHFIGIQRDVTARKRRERLVGVLNRVLRHNLRNDISVVEGYAEVIADATEGTVADHAETIRRTAGDLSAISEKAQTLERTLRDPLAPERRDLVPVVRDVAAELDAAHPGATVECVAPAHQHALATERLTTVLRELGENAVDHAGPDPHVELAVVPPETADDRVRVEVRDDGPGLPDHEARVLREGTETALDHADGLGLWLANWLVTEMGGEVAANVDDGTRITVALRRDDDADRSGPLGRFQSAFGGSPSAGGDT